MPLIASDGLPHQVQKALDGLIWTGSHTVILVAHRLSTVINSHQIVVVDGGRVAESGTHTALLAQGVTPIVMSRLAYDNSMAMPPSKKRKRGCHVSQSSHSCRHRSWPPPGAHPRKERNLRPGVGASDTRPAI